MGMIARLLGLDAAPALTTESIPRSFPRSQVPTPSDALSVPLTPSQPAPCIEAMTMSDSRSVEMLSRPTGLRVLVVDDDAGIRELLRELLVGEGYEVVEATNGQEAVDQARATSPAAVLMDLMMPVLSGAEATAMLKTDPRTSTIPVLAMSAGRNLAAVAHGIPADGFLSKPFNLANLITVVFQHTHGESPTIH